MLDSGEAMADFAKLWPLKRFPVLVDGDRTVMEASIIIEHLGVHHPGPVRLIPEDPGPALDVRMMDRVFDNYVMTPQGTIVFDSLRAPSDRHAKGVADARTMLETSYRWLDERMAGADLGLGRGFQPRRLRRRAIALLCRLDASDRSGLRQPARLPAPLASATLLRPGGRRGATLPALVPARRARPGLRRAMSPFRRKRPDRENVLPLHAAPLCAI